MTPFSPRTIQIILGIGNPGEEFENTYHNIGMLALSRCAAYGNAGEFKHLSGKSIAYAKTGGLIFARSLTFMNESGGAAQDACTFFKIAPSALLVLHDDSDLLIGDFQCAFSRGSAGHKGIDSIVRALGTEEFWRIRIGIRSPQEQKRVKAGSFVLSAIQPDNIPQFEKTFDAIATLLELGSETHRK